MILSAVSLWKKFNTTTPLGASEWGESIDKAAKMKFQHVAFSGHRVSDGTVRIYAEFGRPLGDGKCPAILLLPEAGKELDHELLYYFIEKGYAVLMPDYTGKMSTDSENCTRTFYPPSLSYANFETAGGLEFDETDKSLDVEKTCWFEWTYVALFAIEYLKSRQDVTNIGVIGIRSGGEVAWKTLLSPDIKCALPINAAGWNSSINASKFGENTATAMSPERHRFIAGIESQSYAPFVKCPVLMLGALHDAEFDCDRAYDTFLRLSSEQECAILYSPESGSCIGKHALTDMDLFLEKHLKGREIYIPDPLNATLTEENGSIRIDVEGDEDGLVKEMGIYYAEADVKTKSSYRDWQRICRVGKAEVHNGKFSYTVKPFAGASAVFVYAYAEYINEFRVASKITSKKLPTPSASAIKSRMVFSGSEIDCFGVAQHEDYSVAGIFLENEAAPKLAKGYGGIQGAYSVGGIKTYKISSPQFVPSENALLEFDVYFKESGVLKVAIDLADVQLKTQRYVCKVDVAGGGKWKRIILSANDFKSENIGAPLANFSEGRALLFDCEDEENEYAVTNILWL